MIAESPNKKTEAYDPANLLGNINSITDFE